MWLALLIKKTDHFFCSSTNAPVHLIHELANTYKFFIKPTLHIGHPFCYDNIIFMSSAAVVISFKPNVSCNTSSTPGEINSGAFGPMRIS